MTPAGQKDSAGQADAAGAGAAGDWRCQARRWCALRAGLSGVGEGANCSTTGTHRRSRDAPERMPAVRAPLLAAGEISIYRSAIAFDISK